MRYLVEIKGFGLFVGHSGGTRFRGSFMKTDLCRAIERDRISYHTEVRFGMGRVFVKVTDDEYLMVKMMLTPGLSMTRHKNQFDLTHG